MVHVCLCMTKIYVRKGPEVPKTWPTWFVNNCLWYHKKNNEISLFANAVHNCKMFASVGQIFIDISLENCKPIYRKSLVTSKFWSINMQKEHRLQSALEFLETIEVTVWSPLPCRFSLCRYRLSLCQSTLIRSKTVSILCCCTI